MQRFINDQQAASIRLPLEEASLLPLNCYSDPEFYRFEADQLFMRSWLPVGRIDQVALPGQYFTRELFGEPIVVVRGEQGLSALSNVCRHRGRVIMEGAGQTEKQHMTCPYHAWRYDLQGQLTHAPHMERSRGFKCKDSHLPELALEVWQGFIFVNFDRNAEPLGPSLAPLDKVLEGYNLSQMGCVDFERYTGNWNWKSTLDNFTEAYHQPLVHSRTIEPWVPCTQAVYEDVEGPYNLFYMYTRDGEPFQTMLPPVPGLSEEHYRRTTVINVFPYFHLLIDPSSIMWLDCEIRGAEDHDLVWRLLAPSETLNSPQFPAQKQELHSLLRPVWAEDEYACSGHATGVRSRFAEAGRMSYMEKSLHQFYNWLLDQYQRDTTD